MKLYSLQLEDFRSHNYLLFKPSSSVNLILGKNGAGKTNLLEAMAFLGNAKGFRAQKKEELVSFDAPFFRLSAIYDNDRMDHRSHVEVAVHRKGSMRLKYNGAQEKNLYNLPERLLSVVFTPDDLSLIKEGPQIRRNFLDKDLLMIQPHLRGLRLHYEKNLSQRAKLLKEARYKPLSKEVMESYDLSLARSGVGLLKGRFHLLSLMVPEARKIHRYLAPESGELDATYQSSLGQIRGLDEETLEHLFLKSLYQRRREEILRGTTLCGPHRDDLILYLNQKPARLYASQGQQRTIVLALKLAMVEAMAKIVEKRPILLLDDVFSELDKKRREALLEYIKESQTQGFITATDMADNELKSHHITTFTLNEGKIIQEK